MPRHAAERRTLLNFKIAATGRDAIQKIADAEFGGNVSEAVRALLAEALAARETRKR